MSPSHVSNGPYSKGDALRYLATGQSYGALLREGRTRGNDKSRASNAHGGYEAEVLMCLERPSSAQPGDKGCADASAQDSAEASQNRPEKHALSVPILPPIT
jgi:hypothetical protein